MNVTAVLCPPHGCLQCHQSCLTFTCCSSQPSVLAQPLPPESNGAARHAVRMQGYRCSHARVIGWGHWLAQGRTGNVHALHAQGLPLSRLFACQYCPVMGTRSPRLTTPDAVPRLARRCDPAPFYLFDEIDAALDPQYRTTVARMLGWAGAR